MEKIKVYGSHVVDSLGSETGHLYKGQTIIFSPGNFSTIDSALANCFPQLTAQTFFFKFPKSRITGVVSADNFSRCISEADSLFQQFSHADNFSLSQYPPPPGGNNGPSLNIEEIPYKTSLSKILPADNPMQSPLDSSPLLPHWVEPFSVVAE